MTPRRSRAATALCLSLAAVLAGVVAAADLPATATPAELPLLRQQLGSTDFPTRQSAQKQLDLLPPTLVESLRPLAQTETDPEIKARLEARIHAMDLYLLTHQPRVSLNVKNALLPEVVHDLSRQLHGDPQLSFDASYLSPRTFTLNTQNLSFWEVIRDLNQQHPLAIARPDRDRGEDPNDDLLLTSVEKPLNYCFPDGFAVELKTQAAVNFAPLRVAQWLLMTHIHAAPGFQATQHTSLQIDKLIDQNGNNLLPTLRGLGGGVPGVAFSDWPAATWIDNIVLLGNPAVTHLKELHGTIQLSLAKEHIITLDLSKPTLPVESPRGTITLDKNPAGAWVVHLAPKDPAPAAGPNAAAAGWSFITIRSFDANGKMTFSTARREAHFDEPIIRGTPVTLKLSWTENALPLDLPVEFKDVDLYQVPAGADK